MEHFRNDPLAMPPENGATEDGELSLDELEAESAGELPDRHAMSVIDSSVTIPVNPAIAADVLADTLGEGFDGDEAAQEGETSSR